MAWITTEVEVDLSEFDDEEIRQESEARGLITSKSEAIQELHDAYILNQTSEVDRLLRNLFYENLGRIV